MISSSIIKLSSCLPFLLLALNDVIASSFNEPHSHNGIVAPFQPGEPKVTLDRKALDILQQGKPYQVNFFKKCDNISFVYVLFVYNELSP